jgi:hypothetical protein
VLLAGLLAQHRVLGKARALLVGLLAQRRVLGRAWALLAGLPTGRRVVLAHRAALGLGPRLAPGR